jgi:hypothetical protein
MRPRIPSLLEDSVGTSPSAVAEAMGRMIEEALRSGGPSPSTHAAATIAPVPLPTSAPTAAPPSPTAAPGAPRQA